MLSTILITFPHSETLWSESQEQKKKSTKTERNRISEQKTGEAYQKFWTEDGGCIPELPLFDN